MRTYFSQSKNDFKQDLGTKLRTANNQLLPTKSIVKLTLLPFRDHHAILTITFATADTRNNIPGNPFHQTNYKIDTECSTLILKYNIRNTNHMKQIPFLTNFS